MTSLQAFLAGARQVQNAVGFPDFQFSQRASTREYSDEQPGIKAGLQREEVYRAWRNRIPLTRPEFDEVADKFKGGYATIAHVQSTEGVKRFQELFYRETLEKGQTLQNFKDNFYELVAKGEIDYEVSDDFIERLPGSELTKARYTERHLETVFQTNVQSAYHAGMWRELQDPDVAANIWGYEYITLQDGGVRREHQQMHGFTARADSSVWKDWWPPNGFNCRCTIRIITHLEAEDRGLKESEPSRNLKPDEGFAGNSGLTIGQGISLPVASAAGVGVKVAGVAGLVGATGATVLVAKDKRFRKLMGKTFDSLFAKIARQPAYRLALKYGLTDAEAVAVHAYTLKENPVWGGPALNRSIIKMESLLANQERLEDLLESVEEKARQEFERVVFYREMLDSGLDKMPTYQGQVFRGENMPDVLRKDYIQGQEVSRTTYLSTAIERGSFEGKHQSNVTSIKGADIGFLSDNPFEHEVLFKPETKFLVESVETEKELDSNEVKEVFSLKELV